MKNKAIVALLAAFLVIGFVIGCQCNKKSPEGLETSDSTIVTRVDTLWRDTTITKTEYIPKEVETLRYDTVTKDTVLPVERKLYEDTLINDNDSIILWSYIQGINARLDSTTAQWKKHKEIVTNTVTITKYVEKKKTFVDHFKFGIGIGYGYGFNSKQFEPFVGGSVIYEF